MGINRGKQFEAKIREAFEKIPDTSVVRLIDPQNGFAGICNMCDFIIYHYPHIYLIECKSCYGNTLPFANITDNQWSGLLKESAIQGVISGYIIWFIDHDTTVFISSEAMNQHKLAGYKSVNVKELGNKIPCFSISGKKQRILFDYDMKEFLEKCHTC